MYTGLPAAPDVWTHLLHCHVLHDGVCQQVGRTARGRDGRGRALLLLMPEELGFLKYLKQAKVGAARCCGHTV